MMTGIVMPMAEQLKQRGIVPDMDKYMEIVSKYSHMSELSEILKIADFAEKETMAEMSEMGGGGQAGAGKPPVTERRYVRENVNAEDQQDPNMMKTLMGGGGNQPPSQAATGGE